MKSAKKRSFSDFWNVLAKKNSDFYPSDFAFFTMFA